jgi:hypothetical protein
MVMPEPDFKGQDIHLNPYSPSHTFYGMPGLETGCVGNVKLRVTFVLLLLLEGG